MKTEQAVFGGGCFWCTEAIFKSLIGVKNVVPGYAGGFTENPTYDDVSTGDTGHAEVISIEFDPEEISYEKLLTVFFASHDPTTLNRQGNDIGTQYRSVIFYTTPEQREKAKKFIGNLNEIKNGDKIVTEVISLSNFYVAENYHKDYFLNHSDEPYCQLVINPKLEKVQKEFAELLNSKN